MKPCKSCPFSHESLPGMWEAAHYLAIAYLGSANHHSLMNTTMGCHQWNGIVKPGLSRESGERCGGWLRAAKHTSLSIHLLAMTGKVSMDDLTDDIEVMSPAEMAAAQGLDMERLPPLDWAGPTDRYPTYGDWEAELLTLRATILSDPSVALAYVLPGSPLDVGVTYEQVAAHIGDDAARRYFQPETTP